MPVKRKPTMKVECSCKMNTTIEIKAATAYCAATDYTCIQCGKEFRILDYMNGCICYYEK